jgi:hypothetical protein
MRIKEYIVDVLEVLSNKNPNMFCWAYLDSNITKTNFWYQIVISDVDFYLKNEWLKEYSKELYEDFKSLFGYKIVICATTPQEKDLLKLSEEGNLLII